MIGGVHVCCPYGLERRDGSVTTWLLALIVLVAFVVESAAGFGGTVVSVSLGSQLMPVDDVLLRFLPANLVLSFVMVLRTWRLVDRRILLARIAPWMGGGMAVGVGIARVASPEVVKLVFAMFVLVLACAELRKASRARAAVDTNAALDAESGTELPRAVSLSALVGAGILHGMFACGGPLAVWVLGRDLPNKGPFRATLSALWLGLNAILVATYAFGGRFTLASGRDSGLLLVPLVGGLFLGERIHASLSPARFRVAVFALLAVSSLVLLVRSVAALF